VSLGVAVVGCSGLVEPRGRVAESSSELSACAGWALCARRAGLIRYRRSVGLCGKRSNLWRARRACGSNR
jgi:hypothetical protein